uniref:Uncharacterized protein n=1 Tax=Lepeophtheirus salmonis TaxID=72036 RepID=A0A0K2UUG6_LEPSM
MTLLVQSVSFTSTIPERNSSNHCCATQTERVSARIIYKFSCSLFTFR